MIDQRHCCSFDLAEVQAGLLDFEVDLEGGDLLPQYQQVLDLEQLPVRLGLGGIVADGQGGGRHGLEAGGQHLLKMGMRNQMITQPTLVHLEAHLGQTGEDGELEAAVQLGEGEESSPDGRVPHPVQVRRAAAAVLAGDAPHLQARHTHLHKPASF